MALLRMIYDAVVVLVYYSTGVYMYCQHKNYEYSTHPLTVITCKIGAIILILMSVNLFFSNYANNFIYIIHMKDVGLQRYIKEETADIERGNDKVPDALENEGNAPVDGAPNADQSVAANADQSVAANVDQSVAANVDQSVAANVDQSVAANVDQSVAANVDQAVAASAAENKADDHEQEAILPKVEKIVPDCSH